MTGAQAIADIDVIVVKSLLVPDFYKITNETKGKLKRAFEKLLQTSAESVFKEIAPTPAEVSFERVKADRLELDKIVLRDILGLGEKEHLEVCRAVVDLVKSRLEKAKSVGKKSKKNEGSLGSALAENLLDDFQNGHD